VLPFEAPHRPGRVRLVQDVRRLAFMIRKAYRCKFQHQFARSTIDRQHLAQRDPELRLGSHTSLHGASLRSIFVLVTASAPKAQQTPRQRDSVVLRSRLTHRDSVFTTSTGSSIDPSERIFSPLKVCTKQVGLQLSRTIPMNPGHRDSRVIG
jgi:hypothetical protein